MKWHHLALQLYLLMNLRQDYRFLLTCRPEIEWKQTLGKLGQSRLG